MTAYDRDLTAHERAEAVVEADAAAEAAERIEAIEDALAAWLLDREAHARRHHCRRSPCPDAPSTPSIVLDAVFDGVLSSEDLRDLLARPLW